MNNLLFYLECAIVLADHFGDQESVRLLTVVKDAISKEYIDRNGERTESTQVSE